MIPKPLSARLSISMQSRDINWQTWPQPRERAALGTQHKESELKLTLEARNCGDVMIVHCQGRIVYRDEAAALSHLVGEVLDNGGKVVLDLSGVSSIDSAGIGELVFLHTSAQSQNADLKYASPSLLVPSSQNAWSAGLDAAVGGSPVPDRIDTSSDLLIGGFASAQQHDAADVAIESDSAATDVHGLAIEAFLNGD